MQTKSSSTNILTPDQIDCYNERGYLHLPQMFSPDEIEVMSDDLDWMIETWAIKDQRWTGPWRKKYMDAQTEENSKLSARGRCSFRRREV